MMMIAERPAARQSSSRPSRDRQRSAAASRCRQTQTPADRATGRRAGGKMQTPVGHAGSADLKVSTTRRRHCVRPASTSSASAADGGIERLAKPAERQRPRPRQTRRAPRADRRRASDRNAESRRPARAPCMPSRLSAMRPADVAARRHQHRRAGHGARQHLRLVARCARRRSSTRLPSLTITTPSSTISRA